MKRAVLAALFLFISGIYAEPTVENVTVTDAYDNLTYNIGDIIDIQVVFSEDVNVITIGGTPYLKLETGLGGIYPEDENVLYHSGDGSNTLIFRYTVGKGHYSADLDYVDTGSLVFDGGIIEDLAGNLATLTLQEPGSTGSLAHDSAIQVKTLVVTVTMSGPTVESYMNGSNVMTISVEAFGDDVGTYQTNGRIIVYSAFSEYNVIPDVSGSNAALGDYIGFDEFGLASREITVLELQNSL